MNLENCTIETRHRNYENELREENRILRYMLAQVVHELGRAVHVSEAALLSRTAPPPVVIMHNPMGHCYIVAPEMEGKPRV